MSKDKKDRPDHHDAEIIMRLYELRREAVMRQSREALRTWLPRNWEEFAAVMQPAHPVNAPWRQVSSYFEMAYGFARHGMVHAEVLAENTGEGMFLFAKVLPHLPRMRAEMSPTAFVNSEWIVANTAAAKMRLEMFQKRVATLLAAK